MSLILSIESGTEVCSVAIARDGEVVAMRESAEGRDHARLVALYADELLKECGIAPSELSAVAVSKGPGSYTGLRIGVSFAKGLCYGLRIPLIGVSSLSSLARLTIENSDTDELQGALLAPMVDARRMEVYTQLFDTKGVATTEVEAKIIDEESFSELRAEGKRLILIGDGAAKCREALPWATILDVKPSAAGVAKIADEKFQRAEVEDVAYFEPFYLKDVVITKSKKRFF
ncbi:MAG: tRNA (adenosine(37)-N6)-threonylcarbamoyltransferase complex dimerization subunit type 1 TsaB [Rikenellaceae bacterium]